MSEQLHRFRDATLMQELHEHNHVFEQQASTARTHTDIHTHTDPREGGQITPGDGVEGEGNTS